MCSCEALTFIVHGVVHDGGADLYPEGGSHALQVCQHHHQVVRVGHFVGLSEIGRTRCSRLHRPIRLKPSRSHSAQRALCDREGDGRWPVRPRVRGVFFRAKSRDGDNVGPNPLPYRMKKSKASSVQRRTSLKLKDAVVSRSCIRAEITN